MCVVYVYIYTIHILYIHVLGYRFIIFLNHTFFWVIILWVTLKFNLRHYWGFPTHIPGHNLSVLHRCHPLISTKMVPGPLQNINIYHCSTLLYKTKYNLHLPFCIFLVISRLLIKSNKVEMIYTLYHFILFVKLCKKSVCICSDFYKMSSIHDWLDLQIKNLSTEGSFSSV